MTAHELKQQLSEFSDEYLRQLEVTVDTFGGLRGNNPSVQNIKIGYDWEGGQLVLIPEKTLTFYRQKHERTKI